MPILYSDYLISRKLFIFYFGVHQRRMDGWIYRNISKKLIGEKLEKIIRRRDAPRVCLWLFPPSGRQETDLSLILRLSFCIFEISFEFFFIFFSCLFFVLFFPFRSHQKWGGKEELRESEQHLLWAVALHYFFPFLVPCVPIKDYLEIWSQGRSLLCSALLCSVEKKPRKPPYSLSLSL